MSPVLCGLAAIVGVMGLIALGVLLFPFMKHLDEQIEPEGVGGLPWKKVRLTSRL